MAISNRERIDRALHFATDALAPFVEREMDAHGGASWRKWIDYDRNRKLERRADGSIAWEVQPLLQTMVQNWSDVFKKTLGHAERSLVSELMDVRNRWAHQEAFSYDDTHRALDSAERLLQAVGAGDQARQINAMRQDVLRTMFAEHRRVVERRQTTLTLAGTPKAGLKPWREVITPHHDVATGRYAVAEFAADLAQVHRGDAGDEYGKPEEFYRRTFLTGGLSRLLAQAMARLAGPAAIRSSSCRPTSAAARRTRCSRSTTWSGTRMRVRSPGSTRSWPKPGWVPRHEAGAPCSSEPPGHPGR